MKINASDVHAKDPVSQASRQSIMLRFQHAERMHCNVQEVATADLKLAQRAQAKYKSCVRTTLRLASGYECQDLNGVFMLAFQNAMHAVQWAMLFNMALLQ